MRRSRILRRLSALILATTALPATSLQAMDDLPASAPHTINGWAAATDNPTTPPHTVNGTMAQQAMGTPASSRHAINGTAAVIDSTIFLRYQEPLTKLAEQLSGRGHDIWNLLLDERFEVYERITTEFTQSAERRSPTINDYKQRLGYDDKRNKITEFMAVNMDDLIEAEETYGIPRYVIAAIIGIESDYGRVIGRYNPFNAYVSMIAQEYRSEFALAQLEELLIFTRRHNIDILEMKSSYAGAMAYAQFIPYSLNRWFVGADIYDMRNNISSVANYLAHFLEITGSLERAVYRYNPSDLYTNAVLDLAREAEELTTDS